MGEKLLCPPAHGLELSGLWKGFSVGTSGVSVAQAVLCVMDT